MGKPGLFGLPVPEEYGGDYFALCLALALAEVLMRQACELARVSSSATVRADMSPSVSFAGEPLAQTGTEYDMRT
jgi:alkylation response protein AidB-like acyl-CoA dehydrogenase